MRAFLGLLAQDSHTALAAGVGALTLLLLVPHDMHAFDFSSTVNARHEHVGTYGLVLLNIFSNTLRLALGKGSALDGSEFAKLVVLTDFLVGKNLGAAEALVIAHKLHRS